MHNSKRQFVASMATLLVMSGCGDKAKSNTGAAGASAAGASAAGTGASGTGVVIEGSSGTFAAADGGINDGGQTDNGTPTPSGGTLLDGVCFPGAGPTRADLGASVKVLVKTNGLLFGPVPDATGIYYSIENDGLYRIVPGSDMPEQIVSTPLKRYTPWIADSFLYYRINDTTGTDAHETIERLPLTDLAATPEFIATDAPLGTLFDKTHLYAYDADKQEIYREPIGGGAREKLLGSVSIDNLTLDNHGFLYFTLPTGGYDEPIARIPVTGGNMENVVTAPNFDVGYFVVADKGIYWSDFYGTYYTEFGKPRERRVFGGKDYYIGKITADRVYWSRDTFPSGSVGWTLIDGSDCATIYQGDNEFNGAAVADDGLYCTTFATDNELFRIPLK